MKSHFTMLARYNAWANSRLYAHAGALPDEGYRRDVGAYFKSLHATLNHVLVADRIWMRRLSGTGDHPRSLNAILFEDFASLRAARVVEDQRIVDFVAGLEPSDIERELEFENLKGVPQRQPIAALLAHLFNHQTHHRDWRRIAYPGGVRQHDVALKSFEIRGRDVDAGEFPKSRVDAVDRLALRKDRRHCLGGRLNLFPAGGSEGDMRPLVDGPPLRQTDTAGDEF